MKVALPKEALSVNALGGDGSRRLTPADHLRPGAAQDVRTSSGSDSECSTTSAGSTPKSSEESTGSWGRHGPL
ncbi:MAG: hypothetical protein LC808_10275, partial [Actinobacteria bacterium]|nr:hypothetical protein [Actinomycetota bacterium]